MLFRSLTPADAITQLESRAQRLEQETNATETAMKPVAARIPRFLLLESEYLLCMRKAELQWVRSLLDELRTGKLSWNLTKIFEDIEAVRKAAAMPGKDE